MHEDSRQRDIPDIREGEGLYYRSRAHSLRPVVSTVAPERLHQIFIDVEVGNWESMSILARDTVQSQVDAHVAYAKSCTRTPPLTDLTAVMIPREHTADDLSRIPNHLWANIPYPIFRRLLKATSQLSLESQMDDQIDNWYAIPFVAQFLAPLTSPRILAFEKQLVRTTDYYSDWRFGLVNLEDAEAMFPDSTVDTGARVITRPAMFPGFHVLGALRHLHLCIQPSATLFKLQFDKMTGGLPKDLNWRNVIVAGGIVLGALHAVHRLSPVTEEQWVTSDIDIYVYGLDSKTATEKIDHIFNVYRSNIPGSAQVLVVRNSKTITFYSQYPTRRLQIVLKLVKSPKDVLLNFDLDICAMGWDGSELWMLPRAARALESKSGFNVFTMNLIEGHYLSARRASQEQRVFKYAYRGYGIRILGSYLSSLAESQQNLDSIARGERLFPLNIHILADTARRWTERVIRSHQIRQNTRATPGQPFRCTPILLENGDQKTSEPQGHSCLSGFSVFMRHVALWEMERREEVMIEQVEWAVAFYSEDSDLAYDDTPRYQWDNEFNLTEFTQLLTSFNRMHMTRWLPRNGRVGDVDFGESQENWIVVPQILRTMKRVSYVSELDSVLLEDIAMPVLLPANFALYANTLVEEPRRSSAVQARIVAVPDTCHSGSLLGLRHQRSDRDLSHGSGEIRSQIDVAVRNATSAQTQAQLGDL
ncbi:hypothetical protein GGX14DRAFT_571908 [Mycena pura]|uniref:Uncharacterized protein n=1 Tax=Mycena pura TaxID=153505 RepID=A0AAD6Y4H5_9AGAR|nr:hypothetical protein GGX14DRAFT_571908 [Mycena pura]